MKKMICIVCPVGCHLEIDEHHNVSGNRCARGKTYAIEEYVNPLRLLTTTVKTSHPKLPRLSVKTNAPIPKKLLFSVLDELNHIVIQHDVKVGDVILSNVKNTSVDVIATKNIHFELK
jgi:CxxC motif-containing protein